MKSSMKGTLLAAVGAMALLAGATAGNAATATFGTFDFVYSDPAAGLSAPFGSVTVTGVLGGTAHVVENVAPNFIIDTGGPHQPLAFNLVDGSGAITNLQPTGVFAVGGAVDASPFGSFTNSIQGVACNPGGSGGGCGTSTLSFDIANFLGFNSTLWNSGAGGLINIFFAGDILDTTGGGTGNVGAGAPSPVPLPAAAPLFAAGLGLMGWLSTRRRRRQTAIEA
jgi:hypothetical protein